jgi:nucleotide-binding universal stress UspA family protein
MKVLIATEGSEYSNAAVREFCRIFKATPNLMVKVVSVVEPSFVPTEPFAAPPEIIQQIDNLAKRKAAELVDETAATIRSNIPSVSVPQKRVVPGTPGQVLVQEAREWGADLIVAGSHGHGFWKRAWLGSVSDALIHHAPCSVMIVRQDGPGVV